jgi:hypothetical protein
MIKIADILKEEECNECGRDWNHGHDHEASMAKNELRDMISNASKIDSMVGESDDLPGWVSAYISLAADYMHSVAEYLAGESSRMEMPGPGYGLEENLGHNEIWSLQPEGRFWIVTYRTSEGIKEKVFDSEEKAKHFIGTLSEAKKKPSAGLTKKEKSAVVKKAKSGKDIGKKGKGFEKVAKAAGGGEKGEKIAAAAMWKNIKR